MDNAQFDKLLDAIQKIQISQAVLDEKITQMYLNIERTNLRVDNANSEFSSFLKRIDRLEKIAAGVVIAVAILGTLVKYKII